MGSLDIGKPEAIAWIKEHFQKGETCLDVGACDGKWSKLLDGYLVMDAVEAFEPNIDNHKLRTKYRWVYKTDIEDYVYNWYDLIIFGDVIEHMTVEKAQKVIAYADTRCKDMLIAIPYLWSQPEIYGNKWEVHIQNDLTPKIFDERYPGFEKIIKFNDYCYYHRKGRP